eukprot:8943042-Lingulodinium_polyedra.AAC.1
MCVHFLAQAAYAADLGVWATRLVVGVALSWHVGRPRPAAAWRRARANLLCRRNARSACLQRMRR